jgi:hypothetical protein
MIYTLVSSAKSLIYEFMSRTLPFIEIIKRRGPRMDLLGTLAEIKTFLEEPPGRTTFCFLSVR